MVRTWLNALRAGEMSPGRVFGGLRRRVADRPHRAAWQREAGPGSLNYQRLSALRDRFAGERCVIMGNGPSLASMDLSPLAHEHTFGVNRIYLNFERMGFVPTFYIAVNPLVIEQCAADIARIPTTRFVDWSQRRYFAPFPDQDSLIYLWHSYRPHFSVDLTRGAWGGATVTYTALQIAYYLGFRQVILIGVDHSFTTGGTPHKVVTSDGSDPNHFDPNYFGKGFRWQLPDLKTSESAYRLARAAFEADGRQIVDATVGGRLDVFEKADYHSLFAPARG